MDLLSMVLVLTERCVVFLLISTTSEKSSGAVQSLSLEKNVTVSRLDLDSALISLRLGLDSISACPGLKLDNDHDKSSKMVDIVRL